MPPIVRERFTQRTRQFSERDIYREQNRFGAGVFDDTTMVPKNGVAWLENFINRDSELVGRNGFKAWGAALVALPTTSTGYSTTSTVSGNTRTVTATVGTFAAADVGRWYVHDDGTNELILTRSSSAIITTYTTSAAAKTSTAGKIRGPINSICYHNGQRKFVLHIGTKVYTSDAVALTAWTEVYPISGQTIADDYSVFEEWQDWAFLACTNKVFKARMTATPCVYFWMNSPVPTALITNQANQTATETPDTTLYPYCRRYVYGGARLSGTGHRDRTTSGVVIDVETGTTKFNTSTKRDYGASWSGRPIGDDSTTRGVIACANTVAAYKASSLWNTISDARGKLTWNGTTKDWSANLSGAMTLDEIADRLESAFTDAFGAGSNIQAEYNGTKFTLRAQNEGDTIASLSTPTAAVSGSTSIADPTTNGWMNASTTTETTPKWASGQWIGTLTIPVDGSSVKSAHLTHYPVYGTCDLGVNGVNAAAAKSNDENLYVWVADVPVANPMVVSCANGGAGAIITASRGLFYREDEGSTLVMYNGTTTTRVTIQYLCNASGTQVFTTTSSYACTLTATGTLNSRPAAIGDETATPTMRVIQASQSAYTVTPTVGTPTAGDEGKVIHWDDHTYSVITAVAAGVSWTVADSTSRTAVAGAIDPVSRKFMDTVRDETLKTRTAYYPCVQRGFEEVPSGDEIAIFPEMAFIADRGETVVYQAPMPTYSEYLCGYYYPGKQFATLKDKFVTFLKGSETLGVVCNNRTEVIDTNAYTLEELTSIGVSIKRIVGQTVADYSIGMSHYSGKTALKLGYYMCVTSEPAVRVWDGRKWGEQNLAEDKLMTVLRSADRIYAMSYDPFNGVYLWVKTGSARLNRCFKYGFNKDEGLDWVEITGADWLVAEVGIGTLNVYDTNEHHRVLFMDSRSGYLQDIATRDGPTGSSMFRVRKDREGIDYSISGITLTAGAVVSVTTSGNHGFATNDSVEFRNVGGTDELNNTVFTATSTGANTFTLQGTNGSNFTAFTSGGTCFKAGTDIEPVVKFGEDTGTMERYWMEHLLSSIYVRPINDDVIGDNGYDDNGYPDNLKATASFFVDGALSATAEALEVSMPKHEIYADRLVRGHRLQTQIAFNKGEVRVVGRLQHYKATDAPDTPANRQMTEATWQLALASPSVWMTRGPSLLLNRANGNTLSGSASSATGPDGKTNSAAQITSTVALANAAIANGTIVLWHKAGYTIGGIGLTQYKTSGTWIMSYATGAIGATRSLGTGYVFDVRLYSTVLDTDTLEYLYQDVVNNSGRNTLPSY